MSFNNTFSSALQIFPLNEKIENINDQYWTLRAEEVNILHSLFKIFLPPLHRTREKWHFKLFSYWWNSLIDVTDPWRREKSWSWWSSSICVPLHERRQPNGNDFVFKNILGSTLSSSYTEYFLWVKSWNIFVFLQQVTNFGEPFFFVLHEGETLVEVKARIQKRLHVPDEEFAKVLNFPMNINVTFKTDTSLIFACTYSLWFYS